MYRIVSPAVCDLRPSNMVVSYEVGRARIMPEVVAVGEDPNAATMVV